MRSSRRTLGLSGVLLACCVGCGGWDSGSITSYRLDAADRLVVNGHCNDDGRVRVAEEDSDKVVLRLEVKGSRKGDCLACPTVELDNPLDGREVFDVHTGKSVPLDPEAC